MYWMVGKIYDVHLMKSSEPNDTKHSKKDFTTVLTRLPEEFSFASINIDRCITEDKQDFKERYLDKK